MSARRRGPRTRIETAALVALTLAVLTVTHAAAQTTASERSDSPAWRVTAAILLIAFIATVVALFLTRWRRLFRGSQS